MLIKSQLRWLGHVVRMEDERIPKFILYGQCSQGSRKVGSSLLRYKDKVKANNKSLGLIDVWETLCQSRAGQCYTLFNSLKAFEEQRRDNKNLLRQRRKARPSSPHFKCDICYLI